MFWDKVSRLYDLFEEDKKLGGQNEKN